MDREALDRARRKAEAIGIANVRRHIFLCCDQTTPKCCDVETSLESWSFLKRRLVEVGLTESGTVMRTKANCLRICDAGPIAVVYPEGVWYWGCTPGTPDRRQGGSGAGDCGCGGAQRVVPPPAVGSERQSEPP